MEFYQIGEMRARIIRRGGRGKEGRGLMGNMKRGRGVEEYGREGKV